MSQEPLGGFPEVFDDGTPVQKRYRLNFKGDAVTVADNTTLEATDLTFTVGPEDHPRLHDVDSALDHDKSATGDKGKFVKANSSTGVIEFNNIAAGDLPTTIDATKIADGSVSNTEFQFLNGVTSAIQTQIDAIPGLIWQGAWSDAVEYAIGDGVENDGSAYIAIAVNEDSEPPSADWNLLAAKGDTGDTGDSAYNVHKIGLAYSSAGIGTWDLVIADTELNNGYVATTSAEQDDGIEYKFSAQAGDFDLNLLTLTSAGCGIFTVYVDGVGQGDIDLYSVGAVSNVLKTLEVVTTTAGSHILGLKVEDKNVLATGYCANVNAWWLTDHTA